jgi:hypothetical protein
MGARGSQQTYEGITENGVAQVADMYGLVGVDAGVLDQNGFRDCALDSAMRPLVQQDTGGVLAVEPGVDVSGARNFELGEAGYLAQRGHYFFGNLSRRPTQLLGQLKAEGQRIFSQGDVGRLVNHDARQLDVIVSLESVANLPDKLLL